MKGKLKSDRAEFFSQDGVRTTVIDKRVVQHQRGEGAVFNAKLARETTTMKGPGGSRHVAEMPTIEYNRLLREANGDEQKLHRLIMAWVNDRDNYMFRVWGNKV